MDFLLTTCIARLALIKIPMIESIFSWKNMYNHITAV
jgi:hypothetical protein